MAESHRDEIAKLEALYASNPDGRVFTHLAEAYRRAGELGRAREILARGLQRHDDYASAHVVLGRVLGDQGLDADAADAFRRVLTLDPDNLIARRSLAESDRAAGRDADALTHYRELLAHDPSDEDLRRTVGELEQKLAPAKPPAPSAPPQEWAASHAEESWEPLAPEPIAFDTSIFGGTPAAEASSGDVGTPGQELPGQEPIGQEPVEPPLTEPTIDPSVEAPLSFDDVAFETASFDLGTVDFGGGELPPADAGLSLADFDASLDAQDSAESGLDAEDWGSWPGAPAPETHGPAAEPGAGAFAIEPEAVADLPLAEEPAPEEPVAGEPVAEEPVAEEPVAEEPVAEEPVAEEPVAEEPVAEEPVAEAAPEPTAPADAWPAAATPVAGAADTGDGFDIPTETLAALYRAQGFPDRAAAVYRALVRQRPDDEALRERARAMEDEAEGLRARQTEIEENREVWVSGGADTWDADERVAATHALEEDDDDGADASDGPSIGAYFGRLLAWRPAVPESGVATEAAEAAAEPEPFEAGALDSAPAVVEPAEAEAPDVGPFTFGDATGGTTDTGSVFAFDDTGETVLPETEGPDVALPFDFEPETGEPASFEAAPLETTSPYTFGEEPGAADTVEPAAGDDLVEPIAYGFDEGAPEEPQPFELAGFDVGEAVEDEVQTPFEMEVEELSDEDLEMLSLEPEDTAEPSFAEALGAPDDAGAALLPEPSDAEDETEAPFLVDEPAAAPQAYEPDMLVLDEAEAIAEPAAREDVGWDPTVALADVAPARQPAPAAKPAARPRPVTAPREEEEDDDDLEMFRSWLQSLKK